MPIKSASIKALRKTRKRTQINRKRRGDLKLAIKAATPETISQVFSKIDKAAKTNLISQARAARLKSRLSKTIGATPKAAVKQITAAKKTLSKKTPKPTKKIVAEK